MDGESRRIQLKSLLEQTKKPISGAELSKILGVSRQVIVQDIALLRAESLNIIATSRGYLIYPLTDAKKVCQKTFHTSHKTEEIYDELYTIVDLGGKVLNVVIKHELYGEITVDLIIKSRADADEFVTRIKEKKISPLKELTGGDHYHLVEADSYAILDKIEQALSRKGYLLS